MGRLRSFLAAHRASAAWLVAFALLTKILVPSGFMPVLSGGAIALELCSGHGVETMARTMAMPGTHHDHGKPDGASKDDMPCGFAGHAPASMAAVDPILLVGAVLLLIATVFRRPVLPTVRAARFLRPPLRGPPAVA